MKKRASAVLTVLVAALVGVAALPAHATVTPGAQPPPRTGYDYGASVIREGTVTQYWWCGYGSTSDGYMTDVILYRTYDSSTGTYSAAQTVLAPKPSIATWDRSFICDPAVIKGSFVNSENSATYSYAMYYTATDRGPGSSYTGSQVGTNNRIGIAYSNDGVNWVKKSAPIIYPQTSPTDTYGAGQASIYSYNGTSGVQIQYHDETGSTPSGVYTRRATDGVTFNTPVGVSGAGTMPDGSQQRWGNPDIAFDSANRYWYAAWPLPARSGDGEAYRVAIVRMAETSWPTGTWERLGDVDTNQTGDYLVHNPALVRDKWGNVNVTSPNIEVVYGAGTNDPTTWDLKTAVYTPSTTVPLTAYRYSSTTNTTTGSAAAGYTSSATVGYLSSRTGTGLVPLYNCRAGTADYFVTKDSGCEGQFPLGSNGYLATSSGGAYTVPLTRCQGGGQGHYTVTNGNCGAGNVEGLLGYIRATA